MRRLTAGLAVFLLASVLLQPLPGAAAARVAVLEVRGMVCPA